MTGRRADLLLLGGALALALLLGAGLLAWLRPDLVAPRVDDRRRRHPVYHHGLVPDSTFLATGGVTYRVNRSGFRDDDIPFDKPAGELRVLVLGDSFTEGFATEQEDTFCQVAERLLAGRRGRPAQVINAGCASHSPLLESLLLREEGLRYRPDLVVLALDMSDPQDDFFYERNLVRGEGGEPLRVEGFSELVARNWGWTGRLAPGEIGSDRFFHLRPGVPGDVRRGWAAHFDRTLGHVARAARLARENGAGFLLVTYPYGNMVSPREWEEGRGLLALPPGVARTPFRARIAAMSRREGIPLLDMTPAFRAVASRGEGPLFLDPDGHFSRAGHRLAARLLADAVAAWEAGEGRPGAD